MQEFFSFPIFGKRQLTRKLYGKKEGEEVPSLRLLGRCVQRKTFIYFYLYRKSRQTRAKKGDKRSALLFLLQPYFRVSKDYYLFSDYIPQKLLHWEKSSRRAYIPLKCLNPYWLVVGRWKLVLHCTYYPIVLSWSRQIYYQLHDFLTHKYLAVVKVNLKKNKKKQP